MFRLVVLSLTVTLVGHPAFAQREPEVCGVEFSTWLAERPQFLSRTLVHEARTDRRVERMGGPGLEYPAALQATGWQGTIQVATVVDTNGAVMHAEVMSAEAGQAAPYRGAGAFGVREAAHLMARAALALMRNTQFRAGEREGQPVATVICVPVQFTLRG
jgi:hypothetical protein